VEKLLRALWGSLFALASTACSSVIHPPLVFLPNGSAIVAVTESGVRALDLRTGKALWEHAIERPVANVATSPGGDYVLVQYPATAAATEEGPSAFVVLSSAKGQIMGRAVDPAASLVYPSEDQPIRVDGGRPAHLVSDDGKWFVSASRAGLRIFDVATGKLAFEETDANYGSATFEPRAARLATRRINGLAVYALGSNGWARVAEFPGILKFWWTSKGLSFRVNDTLHIWSDGESSALFPLKVVAEGPEPPRVFFDASGDHVAVQSPDAELVVYSVPAGGIVLRVPKVHDLRAVTFDGAIARVLTYAGKSEELRAVITEYDLSTTKQRGRIELDVVMRLDRPGFFSFGLGGGWTVYRSYVLGPRGLFAGKLEKGTFEMKPMPWAN
jgi:hypothetical protein